MKIDIQAVGFLLWLHLSQALAANHPVPAGEKGPSFSDSQSESPDLGTSIRTEYANIVVEGFEEGDSAPPVYKIFTPTVHYTMVDDTVN